jgi:hypothetical protein
MKEIIRLISVLLVMFPAIVFAGWQVAKPQANASASPFFQGSKHTVTTSPPKVPSPCSTALAPAYGSATYPNRFAHLGSPAPVYAISISGSLKENLERIMERYHWRVIWQAPYDYNFDGRITGSNLPDVVEKLLQPFPLQAVMYMSNRTLTVIPRKV